MTFRHRLIQGLRQLLGGSEGATLTHASDASPLEKPIPERLGRFRVLSKLGQRGMGVVYAARDDALDRSLAIKVIAEELADETAMRRFRREARAAAAVNHPNVCQLYEIGEHQGALYIAMELLEGEPLSDRLKRGSLSAADAVPLALSALSALTALHARGLVHRDLKPSNVLLTPYGVKLLDFGLARQGRPAEALTRARHGLSLSRSRGRRQRVALEPPLSGRALERRRRALLDRRAGSEANRRRGRRGLREPGAPRGPASRRAANRTARAAIVDFAEAGLRDAQRRFESAGGNELLGLRPGKPEDRR